MLRTRLVAAPVLVLLLAPATAQKLTEGLFRNVELCNGASSPETRIEACSAFIEAGRGGPSSLSIAYNNRGIAYAAKADYDRAVADFESAIAIDPAFVKPLNNRGATRLKKGDYARAESDYAAATRLNADMEDAWSGLCWIRAVAGDPQAAMETCDKAIGAGAHTASTYDSRALAHLNVNRRSNLTPHRRPILTPLSGGF